MYIIYVIIAKRQIHNIKRLVKQSRDIKFLVIFSYYINYFLSNGQDTMFTKNVPPI